VPLVAAVPFEGQERKWPEESRNLFRRVLNAAAEVVCVSEGGFSARAMQARNEWVVDRCDALAALWNGSGGGTANCVFYAVKVGRPVLNLWGRIDGVEL
jgi:uncharacterized phage-like protein YoqJ